MTDELSPEFFIFSEMLDNEEALEDAATLQRLGPDGELLLDLRKALREPTDFVPELPEDFAKSTAAAVDLRFRDMPALVRGLVRVDPLFYGPLFSTRTAPWLLLLGGTGLGCFLLSWKALGVFGALLLVGSLAFVIGLKLALPNPLNLGAQPVRLSPKNLSEESTTAKGLFYLLPVMATLFTALLGGRLLSSLSVFSLSFQEATGNLAWTGVIAGFVTLWFLVDAFRPTWKALNEVTQARRGWRLLFQLVHGLWMSAAVVGVLRLHDATAAKEQDRSSLLAADQWATDANLRNVWIAGVALAILATYFSNRGQRRESIREILIPANKRTFSSLFFGGLPILLVLVGAYQLSLTRTLTYPADYEAVTTETEQWMAEQKAIPPEQNGWMDLREIFLRQDVPTEEIVAIQARLKQGGELDEYWFRSSPSGPPFSDKEATERARLAKVDFLLELPRIQAAMAKPKFSYAATQDLSMQTVVPNFVLCRSVSQGLAGLAADAFHAGNSEESLRYTELGLAWASKFRGGGLISLMIGVAQLKITTATVEGLVLEGGLSVAQLRSLQKSLEGVEFSRNDYRETMMNEVYMVDRAFREILLVDGGDPSAFSVMSDGGMASGLARVMPKSYWESERKAYLNFQLAQLSDWRQLARPSHVKVEEVLPFNLAMHELVPYTARAQAQFMSALSQLSALRLVTALEIYQREKGHYPESLNQLVPAYIASLPMDAMSPNLWDKKPTFAYLRTSAGYELISESSVYHEVGMKVRQVYGHDGSYQTEMAPRSLSE